ncbi:G-protein coupled receptor GRL101-like [Amphiura filiformis]|uniref:G-protein coupled receptor GRL101-like n=1 Tax=Amphiura filiformis TaxID=82378 RepID=UPI003B22625B
MASNRLTKIPNIRHLTAIQYFDIAGNSLTRLERDTFLNLPKFTSIFASQHEICQCFVSGNSSCSADGQRSPYLTCNRLLSDKALVVMMWFIGMNALGGNIFVLTWRRKASQKNKVQDLLLSNLAMSDLLMGLYMLLIASADVYFGDYFPMQSETWRTGITCRIAGALSILSSEASVFFVTIISIDRFLCTKFPHAKILDKKSTIIVCTMVWFLSSSLGIIPSVLSGRNFKFYDNSHVCIGLPLALTQRFSTERSVETICPQFARSCYTKLIFQSRFEGFEPGMFFSTAIFIGLNNVCYLGILACYVEIIRVVYKSSRRAGLNQEMKEQMRLTFKVAAIVATDFACWFPVILLGILVQARVLTLPPSVYAWCVTFVLPINSAINPYLYTIAAVISSHRKRRVGDTSTSQSSGQRHLGSRSHQAQEGLRSGHSTQQTQQNESTA